MAEYVSHKDFAQLIQHIVKEVVEPLIKLQAEMEHLSVINGNLQHQINQKDARINDLESRMAFLVAKDTLDEGLLPEMSRISLLEVQVWWTDFTKLTAQELRKARQAGHTEWPLRIRASVGGRRIKKEINVGLYSGEDFARQVFNADPDRIPETIGRIAEIARQSSDPTVLFGMLKRITSGGGSPYSRDHFAVLSGHLQYEPQVEIWSQGIGTKLTGHRPSAGTKETRSKWYLKGKPTLICT